MSNFRRWIGSQIDELAFLAGHEFDPQIAEHAEAVVREAADRAAGLGFPELFERGRSIQVGGTRTAMTYLAECLKATGAGKAAGKYLASEAAADYLGITVKSLYGLVELGRLTPLRGPKRSYRFTPQMLDKYLTCPTSQN